MTKAKGRRRRRRHVRTVEERPTGAEPAEDARDTSEETEYQVYLGAAGEDRVIVRLVTERGQLIDFAMIQETIDGGQWRAVVRYDCSHGTVHVHRFRHGGRRPMSKKVVATLEDIETAFLLAERGIYDAWEENRRVYFEKGRRRGPDTARYGA